MSSLSKHQRFLTVQSHVVSGYCGNKCSTFPLQLLGFEVDVINSVQLSNHTQYSVAEGQIYSGEDLRKLHSGLKKNGLLNLYDNVLSGYIGSIDYIHALQSLVNDIKQVRPDCIYSLDPVLGDTECGFYVPDGHKISFEYLDKLVPLADIITPNAFEASILTGLEFKPKSSESLGQAIAMIKKLHSIGVPMVALTSFEASNVENELSCILSLNPDSSSSKSNFKHVSRGAWIIHVPKIPGVYYGTGDMFASLLSAWLVKTNMDLKKSLENTINTINDILLDTREFSMSFNCESPLSSELRIVQNQAAILKPMSTKLVATPIIVT